MGRPRKYPVIAGDSASAVRVEEKGNGKPTEDAPTKGRKSFSLAPIRGERIITRSSGKKRVAADKSLEGGQRKRAKIDDDTPNQLPKAEEVVVKGKSTSELTNRKISSLVFETLNNRN